MSKISAIAVGVAVVLIVGGIALQRGFAAITHRCRRKGRPRPRSRCPIRKAHPWTWPATRASGWCCTSTPGYDHGLHDRGA